MALFYAPRIAKNPPAMTATELFTFDNADLNIRVVYHGVKVIGKVSSCAVARASPVWKNFIHPPWQPIKDVTSSESEKIVKTTTDNTTTTTTVATTNPSVNELYVRNHDDDVETTITSDLPFDGLDFHDGNGEAVLLLLNIVHLKFDDIPKAPPTELLHDVAELCDMYDCVELLKPWLEKWMTSPQSDGAPCYRWMFTAWVFGMPEVFVMVADRAAKSSDAQGNALCGRFRVALGDVTLPPGAMESIMRTRYAAVSRLLQTVQTHLNRLTTAKSWLCQQANSQPACDASFLGGLIMALVTLRIYPDLNPDHYNGSAHELHRELHFLVSCGDNFHGACRDSWETRLKMILPDSALDCHKEHMRIQAEKLKLTQKWDKYDNLHMAFYS